MSVMDSVSGFSVCNSCFLFSLRKSVCFELEPPKDLRIPELRNGKTLSLLLC